MEETEFESFDALLTAAKAVDFLEGKSMGMEDILKSYNPDLSIENWNDYCAVSAHSESVEAVKAVAETFNLGIMTYIVSDDGFSLSTGIHRVNREYFLFYWNKEVNGYANDEDDVEYDEDGNIIDEADEQD